MDIPVSPRLTRIKLSPSTSATQRVRELVAQGRDIIGLTIGEPDFTTPEHVKEAAWKAMEANHTRYTNVDGIDELKEAIRFKFKRDNDLDFSIEEVMASSGSKQVVFNIMMSLLQAGDEVIIPAPYWVSYLDMVLVSDGIPVGVACGPETGFKLTPEMLERAITPKTRILMLNSPSNPTGSVYSPAELKQLAEVLRRHPDVWIVSDDIYEHLVFEGAEFTTFAKVAPDLAYRTITVNGVSKAYAMTGWRLGFAAGDKRVIKNMAKLQSQSTANPCTISQHAAIAAIRGPQEFLKERAKSFQDRRDLVMKGLEGATGLDVYRPDGAFYLYPGCGRLLGKRNEAGKVMENEQDVVMHLLDHGVAVIQGEAYGLAPYFRLSIASPVAELTEAAKRICEAVTALR